MLAFFLKLGRTIARCLIVSTERNTTCVRYAEKILSMVWGGMVRKESESNG